jgi:hypothetical protein
MYSPCNTHTQDEKIALKIFRKICWEEIAQEM